MKLIIILVSIVLNKMIESMLINEFTRMARQIDELKVTLRNRCQRKLIDIESLLELSRDKPALDYALGFSTRIEAFYPKTEKILEISRFLKRETDQLYISKNLLTNYRIHLESFQKLMKGCLSGGVSSEEWKRAYSDWKQLRLQMVKLSFFDQETTKEFVVLESMFRIILFYKSEANEEQYLKTKTHICRLISKWEAEDLIKDHKYCNKLLNHFLLHNKFAANCLGKRTALVKEVTSGEERQIEKRLIVGQGSRQESEGLSEMNEDSNAVFERGLKQFKDNYKSRPVNFSPPKIDYSSQCLNETPGKPLSYQNSISEKKSFPTEKSIIIDLENPKTSITGQLNLNELFEQVRFV
jgi:hypothetical protein